EKGHGYWDALTELLLVTAARREHLVKTIWPALERGAWVISDRFADSTRVYQAIGLNLGIGIVDHFYEQIAEDFEPHLTLLLDLPVEVGLGRMTARGGQDDRYQQQKIEFHQQLRDGYLALVNENAGRFRVIDASTDSAAVTTSIVNTVDAFFDLRQRHAAS
ncbi:MAG: dTMP kinase, partial [Alphaproteobacteria bacterium]|nr:dTMP kinase [Alphaproteobacteria bacterium]